jgi:hypothetical protein
VLLVSLSTKKKILDWKHLYYLIVYIAWVVIVVFNFHYPNHPLYPISQSPSSNLISQLLTLPNYPPPSIIYHLQSSTIFNHHHLQSSTLSNHPPSSIIHPPQSSTTTPIIHYSQLSLSNIILNSTLILFFYFSHFKQFKR